MMFAVHLSDSVVADPWVIAGWVVAVVIVLVSAHRIREEEIPQIGVLTAAFFVASLLHFKLGPVSVHLLLNGLVGVILRRRAGLAIAVGVALQTVLFGHGGLTTLGLNVTEYVLPAAAAGLLFTPARRVLAKSSVARLLTMSTAALLLFVTGVLAAQWLWVRVSGHGDSLPTALGSLWVADPLVVVATVGLAAVAGVAERRIEPDGAFPLGVLLGGLTAYATVVLNCGIIWLGGLAEVRGVAPVVLLAHLPVVGVEAVAVGFVVSFLSRVKPEWLGIGPDEAAQRAAGSGKTSSNGTSH